MAATIVDVSTYGDSKGRDIYGRNTFSSVKGDTVTPNSLTQGFYGIPSAGTTEYELMRLTVSEGNVDDEIGTLTFGVRDGSSLNDVMSLNNLASEITTTTLTLTATDIIASGNLNVSTLIKDDQTDGVSIELVDSPTTGLSAINFVLGDLGTAEFTPLIIAEETVSVTGTLLVGGTDILATITGGNLWEATGAVGQLKTAYTSIEINVVNPYATTLALDVNGTTRIRGNDIFFYDETTNHYSVLNYDPTGTEVHLRSSRAGDSLIFQTATTADNTYLPRLAFASGAGDQNVTFTNSFVGIGGVGTNTYPLEVTGGASLTAGLLTGGDVDVAGNNLVNVVNIDSNQATAGDEQVRLTLTSDPSDPQLDVVLGILGGVSVTAMSLTETTATINVTTTVDDNLIVTGDLTVSGTTVTLNTSEVSVEDINIELASGAGTALSINGGGITLGTGVGDLGGNIPAITFNSTTEAWDSSIGISVDAGQAVTIGTTVLSASGLALNAAAPYIYFGAAGLGAAGEWRLGIYSDGSGDHFTIEHDDLDNGTYVSKFDVLE